MCEFLKERKNSSLESILLSFFSHYCSFSSAVCLCPFLCILKATVLLQVSAHRGGLRLPGCRTQAGRHRWKTKPCSLFSLADFFNNRKLELLLRATACWHCLFMFKARNRWRGSQSETLPASNCNKKKTSWFPTPLFSYLGKFELKRKCLQLEIIKMIYFSMTTMVCCF